MNRAVFLDRDGVLIEDIGPLMRPEDIRILEGVPEALTRLHAVGLRLIVVSNQTVIARGLLTESDTWALEEEVECRLRQAGGPPLDGVYFCPHHPNATVPAYRSACDCRKPRPGLLLRASVEHCLDTHRSFSVGDRPSDIVAGARVGCRTVWVQTGHHLAPPIEAAEPYDPAIQPDHVCANLPEAVEWILRSK